ncbi:hypothetical protein T01_9434 [Trichinella spiralis]|uniref:Uncharacterized protein n=1 Tax=Trichinella spiralis TaxID=6334 RepID=A0A0V1BJY2_TRISP|nr:hypothetical protein T01_9434 [Trichinella spiralis]
MDQFCDVVEVLPTVYRSFKLSPECLKFQDVPTEVGDLYDGTQWNSLTLTLSCREKISQQRRTQRQPTGTQIGGPGNRRVLAMAGLQAGNIVANKYCLPYLSFDCDNVTGKARTRKKGELSWRKPSGGYDRAEKPAGRQRLVVV